MLEPKHTIKSVLTELASGLEDGSIVVEPKCERGLIHLPPAAHSGELVESAARIVLLILLIGSVAFAYLSSSDREGIASVAVLIIGIASLLHLISARHLRERAKELEDMVRARTAELTKANAAKDEFLAGISHEIRNPMNSVIGLTASIDSTKLDPESRRRFEILRNAAAHLSSLVENILDFSQLQNVSITIAQQSFDLLSLIESISAITATESAKSGIPVETIVAPGVPRYVVGDAARIRQILLNFVDNALRYAGRGTVELTVRSRKTEKRDHAEIVFAVSDNGPGIPAGEVETLFSGFTRGAFVHGRKPAGIGIGLSMCRILAEKMGGRVWVDTAVGQGSTFSFSVVLRMSERPALPTHVGELQSSAAKVFDALIVDDEEYNSIAMAALLEPLGYVTKQMNNFVAALLEARRIRFDLVVVDLDIAGGEGIRLARELTNQRAFGTLVIGTTAFCTPERKRAFDGIGIDGIVTRPVTLEKVRGAINHALSSQHRATMAISD